MRLAILRRARALTSLSEQSAHFCFNDDLSLSLVQIEFRVLALKMTNNTGFYGSCCDVSLHRIGQQIMAANYDKRSWPSRMELARVTPKDPSGVLSDFRKLLLPFTWQFAVRSECSLLPPSGGTRASKVFSAWCGSKNKKDTPRRSERRALSVVCSLQCSSCQLSAWQLS